MRLATKSLTSKPQGALIMFELFEQLYLMTEYYQMWTVFQLFGDKIGL
jgi:hypothetical protein